MSFLNNLTKIICRNALQLHRNTLRLHRHFASIRELQKMHDFKVLTIRNHTMEMFDESNGDMNWDQLFNQLITKNLVRKENMEVMVMAALQIKNQELHPKKELISSFIDYVEKSSRVMSNYIIASKYCAFLGNYADYINEKDSRIAKDVCEYILNKYKQKSVTYPLVQECIDALAKTSRDNCSYVINILPEVSEIITKNESVINNLIGSAFKYNLNKEAIQLAISNSTVKLNETNVSEYLNFVIANGDESDATKLFEYFKNSFVICNYHQKEMILNLLEKFGFNAAKTSINNDGLCHKCGHIMTNINCEDFDILNKSVKELFHRKNSSVQPSQFGKEIIMFDDFIFAKTIMKPFDLIIDGLNASFTCSGKLAPNHKKGPRKLISVKPVKDLDRHFTGIIERNNILSLYENILIIGRKHMESWPKLKVLLHAKSNVISHFFTNNQTADDAFILYAATRHPKTLLLSNDLFRDYSDKITDIRLDSIFHRWLQTRQIYIGDGAFLEFPHQYDVRVNLGDNHIHIPVQIDEEIQWICCNKRSDALKIRFK